MKKKTLKKINRPTGNLSDETFKQLKVLRALKSETKLPTGKTDVIVAHGGVYRLKK